MADDPEDDGDQEEPEAHHPDHVPQHARQEDGEPAPARIVELAELGRAGAHHLGHAVVVADREPGDHSVEDQEHRQADHQQRPQDRQRVRDVAVEADRGIVAELEPGSGYLLDHDQDQPPHRHRQGSLDHQSPGALHRANRVESLGASHSACSFGDRRDGIRGVCARHVVLFSTERGSDFTSRRMRERGTARSRR